MTRHLRWVALSALGLVGGCFDTLDPGAFDVPPSEAREDGGSEAAEDAATDEPADTDLDAVVEEDSADPGDDVATVLPRQLEGGERCDRAMSG